MSWSKLFLGLCLVVVMSLAGCLHYDTDNTSEKEALGKILVLIKVQSGDHDVDLWVDEDLIGEAFLYNNVTYNYEKDVAPGPHTVQVFVDKSGYPLNPFDEKDVTVKSEMVDVVEFTI